MREQLNKVDLFNKVFKIYEETPKKPKLIPFEEAELRFELMKEENLEYLEAYLNNDLKEVADALGDQLYILCGTILKHGLQDKIVEVFEEIHRSNISKLDVNGNPIFREDGKVLKGEGYFKPDIKTILKR